MQNIVTLYCRFNLTDIVILIPETLSVFRISFLFGFPVPYILFVDHYGLLNPLPANVENVVSF
jgi:hypothetical protein